MTLRVIRNWLTLFPLILAGCEGLSFDKKVRDTRREEPAPTVATPAPAPRINPSTHIAAGQMLEKRGDFSGAIDQYEKAVAAAPKQSGGYNRLGIIYQKLGRHADADQMFRQGLAVDPRSAMLHNNLGFTQLAQKQLAEAEDSFRRALAISPEFKRARMNLAITAAHGGRLDESVAEFSRVVPRDVAYYNVAAICLHQGDRTGGVKCLTRALEVNPDCPGAREQLTRLTHLPPPEKNVPREKTATRSPLAGDPVREPEP